MAEHCLILVLALLGLLVNVQYSALQENPTQSKVVIIQEPETTKDCYKRCDNGSLTLAYNVTDESEPLDKYKVLWKYSSTVYIDGTTILIYEGREDRRKQDARWTASMTYNDRTVMFRMDIVHLDYEDDRGQLFAHIVDVCTGEEVAMSTSGRAIHVDQNCPESSPFGGKYKSMTSVASTAANQLTIKSHTTPPPDTTPTKESPLITMWKALQ